MHDDVSVASHDPSEPPLERVGRAEGSVLCSRTAVGAGERGEPCRVEVDVQHLAGGVHAGVGSTGDNHAWPNVAVPAEQCGQGGLDLSLHGAQTGLGRPACEGGAVVREVDAHAHDLRVVVPLTVIHSWRVYGASSLTARLHPRDP